MKRLILLLAVVASSLSGFAQSDPVVMRINGKDVTRSEFEYNYNKNNSESVLDKKTLKEYVPLFVDYKLKVEAALDNKLDTLSSFQEEFRHYRDQYIRPYLVPQSAREEQYRKYYDVMANSLQGKPMVKPAHIFLRLPQTADSQLQTTLKNRADSLYQLLQDGADFAELAKKYSDDAQSAQRGGTLAWIGPNQTLKEFEDVVYSLSVGEISKPFLSTVGFHIVKLEDQKELESYEELKPRIVQFLERQGLDERLSSAVLDSLSSASNDKPVEQILDEETERLCAQDIELKYLVKEYHDGLLLFEECSRNVWEPAKKDTVAIESFFAKNKKKYAWKEPHFRGMLYYCRQQADVKAVQKSLKKVDERQWLSTIRQQFNRDSVMIRTEIRMFIPGDNANADSFIFKKKQAKPQLHESFPYVGVMGKMLKKGPAVWTDVKDQVVTDYTRQREEAYVKGLRQRYEVQVFDDVLQTVNNH